MKTRKFLAAITAVVMMFVSTADAAEYAVLASPIDPQIGEVIHFGTHDWRVLDVQDGKALVITEQIIARGRFHETSEAVTWETSDMRYVLNGYFYYTFTPAERERIAQATVINADNPQFDTCGGNDTIDKIFLLSLDEAERYFADDNARVAQYYGMAFWGIYGGMSNWWWLRSPGGIDTDAAVVGLNGDINAGGYYVRTAGFRPDSVIGIRPALWLYLDIPAYVGRDALGAPYYANASEYAVGRGLAPAVIAPQVGEVIHFGAYRWRVLDVQGGRALLLTDRIILHSAFHHGAISGVTWEYSDMRYVLNGYFYYTFTPAERARIAQTTVINSGNPWFGTHGGNNTTDRIFLLSLDEVLRYFGDSGRLNNRRGNESWIADEYNNARLGHNYAGGAAWWLLRTPGRTDRYVAGVGTVGSVFVMGSSIGASGGIRPAMWVYTDYGFEARNSADYTINVNANVLRFVLGSRIYSKNWIEHEADAAPFLDTYYERTMVPLRIIAEAMGAEVDWDDATRMVFIDGRGGSFSLTIDEPLPDGMGAAVIVDDRTFVPARYVAEMLGARVLWDGVYGAVYIMF